MDPPSFPFDATVARWFAGRVGVPTEIQRVAWPRIAAGAHVLVSAPTGSGKTLTAFLFALERLLTGEWPGGGVRVLYVSPLKALNTDVRVNLLAPLAGLRRAFSEEGRTPAPVSILTRSGDTPPAPAPPPGELGLAYARLGYTHVHEPYLTLVTAGQVHRRLAALPVVDASASLVVNLRDLDLWLKDPDRLDEVAQALDLMLTRTRAWNLSIVEPFVRYRQEFYAHRALDTGAALPVLARLAQALGKKFFLEATPEVLAAAVHKPKAFHLANLGQALASDALVEEALRHLAAGTTMDMGLMLPGPPSPALPVQVDLGWSRPLELAPLPDEGRGRRALAVARNHQGLNLAFHSSGARRMLLIPAWEWERST